MLKAGFVILRPNEPGQLSHYYGIQYISIHQETTAA